MNRNFNVLETIKVFLKYWWIMIITAVLVSSGAYVYSEYFADDIYISKGSFYVSSATKELDAITISTLNANSRFSETYIELAKSDSVLEQVRQNLINDGYRDISVAALRSALTFSVLNETEVLSVTAAAREPHIAQAITNAVLAVAPGEIKRIVKAGGAEVVDVAKRPTRPTYPNVLKNTIFGFVAGIFIGCAIIFIIKFFDLRIKPENDLTDMYGIPVIGSIPEIRG